MANGVFAFEKALKNKTKKEILASKLLEMIFTGLLRDGDELPSERELSQLFSVSRETVRGALGVVAAYGLIQVSHGAKTRINRTETLLKRCRELLPELSNLEVSSHDINTVFESRKVVEAGIVRRAAQNVTAEQLRSLRQLVDQQRDMFDDPVRFQLSDKQFHKLIGEISSNEVLLKYSEELYAYGLQFRRMVMNQVGSIEQSYQEHVQIVDALEQHNPDAAAAAVMAHIDSVHRTTLSAMGDAG
ncbi:MAG: FCD domain-containing protein [Motiliproteus sp.]